MADLQPCASCGKPASCLCPWTNPDRDEVAVWCITPTCPIIRRPNEAAAVKDWNGRKEVGRE